MCEVRPAHVTLVMVLLLVWMPALLNWVRVIVQTAADWRNNLPIRECQPRIEHFAKWS